MVVNPFLLGWSLVVAGNRPCCFPWTVSHIQLLQFSIKPWTPCSDSSEELLLVRRNYLKKDGDLSLLRTVEGKDSELNLSSRPLFPIH